MAVTFYLQNEFLLANRSKSEMAPTPNHPVRALEKGLDVIETLVAAASVGPSANGWSRSTGAAASF
jgi:hypothetical protein